MQPSSTTREEDGLFFNSTSLTNYYVGSHFDGYLRKSDVTSTSWATYSDLSTSAEVTTGAPKTLIWIDRTTLVVLRATGSVSYIYNVGTMAFVRSIASGGTNAENTKWVPKTRVLAVMGHTVMTMYYFKINEGLCVEHCSTCSDTDTSMSGCTACDFTDPRVYDTGDSTYRCKVACDSNQGWKDDNICYPCSVATNLQCASCEDTTLVCKTCNSGYTLTGAKFCQKVCDSDQAWFSSGNTCETCRVAGNPSCATCEDETKVCQSCDFGFYLEGGICKDCDSVNEQI